MKNRLGKTMREANPAALILSHVLVLVPAVCIITASFLLTPEKMKGNSLAGFFLPKCYFHSITGLECPCCGMSRAFVHIAHGQFEKAVELNRFSLVLYALILLAGILSLFSLVFVTIYLYRKSKKCREPQKQKKSRS